MHATRLCFCLAASLFIALLTTAPSHAETWTDTTGKFSVEAEYVGVEGRNVVLRKADGKTLSVPIARLSADSRAQAKRLYDLSKSGTAAATMPGTRIAPEPVAATAPAPAKALNFTPPQPPPIPPLPEFPDDPSLQGTVDFVKAQVLAGHPEVLWHAMPKTMRATLDDDQFRNQLNPFVQQQAAASKQMEAVVMKAIEVLVTKKEFVLNSPLMGQVPPPLVPTVQQAYDPAVGLIYEVSMMSFSNVSLAERSISDMVAYHGPRIGAHAQALIKLAPPGSVDGILNQVVVEQTSESSGTITVPDNQGGTEATDMVKYEGRWLPKDVAESWEANKTGLIDKIVESLNQAEAQREATGQQPAAMIGMFAMMANSALDPMLAATTQAEFDQAIMRIMAMIPNAGGNVGPGGNFGPLGAGAGLNLDLQ